jgi:NAD(P)-dependent dehydrogenase (short-subunit alcohol dehydrogenase family)
VKIDQGVALVTGGASGLGLATVRALHTEGAGVVILDLASSDGKAIADELGDRAVFAPADVTDTDAVQDAVDTASALETLRVAVNCAGRGGPARNVGKDGPAPLDPSSSIIATNLIGTFNVIRLAAARISEAAEIDGERGVIVNTASVAAFDGQIGQAPYSASKGGIVGMTLPIARDLANLKIRVVTIAPGLFRTPLFGRLGEDKITALEQQVPHPSGSGIQQNSLRWSGTSSRTRCSTEKRSGSTARSEWHRADNAVDVVPRFGADP